MKFSIGDKVKIISEKSNGNPHSPQEEFIADLHQDRDGMSGSKFDANLAALEDESQVYVVKDAVKETSFGEETEFYTLSFGKRRLWIQIHGKALEKAA